MADKTNPIPRTAGVSTTQKMRNEPNSPPRPPCPTPKKRNEPNFHRSQISNLRFPPIRHGVLCETNPICPHSPLCHNQNIRNEPNPGTHSVRPPYPPRLCETNPIYPGLNYSLFTAHYFTKRTQFHPCEKCETNPNQHNSLHRKELPVNLPGTIPGHAIQYILIRPQSTLLSARITRYRPGRFFCRIFVSAPGGCYCAPACSG